jgi:hypothetical protein
MGFLSKRSEAERPVHGPGLSMLCTMGLSLATFAACSTPVLWTMAEGCRGFKSDDRRDKGRWLGV